MPPRRPDAPLDYLHSASTSSLESYELSRLNHAANLRREISVLLDQWIDETVQARLARWMIADRSTRRVSRGEAMPLERRLRFEAPVVPRIAKGRARRASQSQPKSESKSHRRCHVLEPAEFRIATPDRLAA